MNYILNLVTPEYSFFITYVDGEWVAKGSLISAYHFISSYVDSSYRLKIIPNLTILETFIYPMILRDAQNFLIKVGEIHTISH